MPPAPKFHSVPVASKRISRRSPAAQDSSGCKGSSGCKARAIHEVSSRWLSPRSPEERRLRGASGSARFASRISTSNRHQKRVVKDFSAQLFKAQRLCPISEPVPACHQALYRRCALLNPHPLQLLPEIIAHLVPHPRGRSSGSLAWPVSSSDRNGYSSSARASVAAPRHWHHPRTSGRPARPQYGTAPRRSPRGSRGRCRFYRRPWHRSSSHATAHPEHLANAPPHTGPAAPSPPRFAVHHRYCAVLWNATGHCGGDDLIEA